MRHHTQQTSMNYHSHFNLQYDIKNKYDGSNCFTDGEPDIGQRQLTIWTPILPNQEHRLWSSSSKRYGPTFLPLGPSEINISITMQDNSSFPTTNKLSKHYMNGMNKFHQQHKRHCLGDLSKKCWNYPSHTQPMDHQSPQIHDTTI